MVEPSKLAKKAFSGLNALNNMKKQAFCMHSIHIVHTSSACDCVIMCTCTQFNEACMCYAEGLHFSAFHIEKQMSYSLASML